MSLSKIWRSLWHQDVYYGPAEIKEYCIVKPANSFHDVPPFRICTLMHLTNGGWRFTAIEWLAYVDPDWCDMYTPLLWFEYVPKQSNLDKQFITRLTIHKIGTISFSFKIPNLLNITSGWDPYE